MSGIGQVASRATVSARKMHEILVDSGNKRGKIALQPSRSHETAVTGGTI
jgi:hypothetical protein